MRTPFVIAVLALLLVPSLAGASPRFRFESGQVTAPLDSVPYFYVTATGGAFGQNACQSGHAGFAGCASAPANSHWDFSDPAHPVFVDDDPANARCFWFSAENSFGFGIAASSFHVTASLLDPSGAMTPVSADLPQLPAPGTFNNPQVDLGGSGPGAASKATCVTPPAVVPGAGSQLDDPEADTTVDERVTAPPARRRKTPARTPARRGGRAGDDYASKVCGAVPSNVNCAAGAGRQTSGGGEKVSHRGWPSVTGVLWKVLDSSSRNKVGGALNDELLGHHGSDHISGGAGRDILWGDWDPRNNNTRQRDVLLGGSGADYIYPSHGRTLVKAGAGNDYIWAFYGKGTIDCGPGKDTVHVRMNGSFKLKGCETVKHFCSFGSDAHGNCLKPGEKARRRG